MVERQLMVCRGTFASSSFLSMARLKSYYCDTRSQCIKANVRNVNSFISKRSVSNISANFSLTLNS